MVLSVDGKFALVTGGGSGINLAFVRVLLDKGCSVIIGDLQLSPEAEALLGEYPHPRAHGKPSAVFHKTDVTSWPQLAALWRAAVEAFAAVDIVVPGAGIFDPPWSSFWEPPRTETNPDSASRDPADAEPGHYAVLDVNLVHPIRLAQLAIGPWTQKKEKGTLVFVGSIAGYISTCAVPLYIVSKHGIHAFVRSLASFRDQLGIRVGCVAPALVKTRIWDSDPARSAKILVGCEYVPVDKVAQAMLELAVNEEYGDGTILEVAPPGTRVVPEFDAPAPAPDVFSMTGLGPHITDLVEHLKTKGLEM